MAEEIVEVVVWGMQRVTVLYPALVVRTSKCQELV